MEPGGLYPLIMCVHVLNNHPTTKPYFFLPFFPSWLLSVLALASLREAGGCNEWQAPGQEIPVASIFISGRTGTGQGR